MKNQKGITLIALVITIIVLLILAGVSIAMLTGENGILNQAKGSKAATVKAEAVEKINLALNAVKSEIYNQQVSNTAYNAAPSATTTTTDITKILGKDAISATSAPASGEGYWYTIADSKLTIHYVHPNEGIKTDAPIEGSIELTTPYTINKAPIGE